MDWTPGQMSEDIEDRRGDSSGGGPGFSFGGGGIGAVGVIILLVASVVTGHNYLGSVLGGGSSPAPQQARQEQNPNADPSQSAAEDRSAHLVSFVLEDAQHTWEQIFARANRPYRKAKLVLYRGQTYSGCGTARSQTGPFYCPQDEKIYIDLNFWDELRQLGGNSADFAQAYVVAHEFGHHIQKLLGIEGREQRAVQQTGEQNALSVDLELQADCFAGVWGHSTEQRNIVHPNDVADALKAAAAVGDDHISKMQGRAVSPENFTHGTSAQREHWFTEGLQTGEVQDCNTFNGQLAP